MQKNRETYLLTTTRSLDGLVLHLDKKENCHCHQWSETTAGNIKPYPGILENVRRYNKEVLMSLLGLKYCKYIHEFFPKYNIRPDDFEVRSNC